MIALLIGYIIVGLITWAGVIIELCVDGHIWRPRDAYGLLVTMAGIVALWPVAFAWHERCLRRRTVRP